MIQNNVKNSYTISPLASKRQWLSKSLEPNCYKIIIEGQTSFSIQGRGLREKIEKIVNGANKGSPILDIKGKVQNLKDGRVEIVCFGADVDNLYAILMKWKEDGTNDEIYIRNCTKHDHYDSEIRLLNDFKTERSDDQSEMIWALRGAGDRFAESTKELQHLTEGMGKIHDNLIERDKKFVIGRLLTLYYELIHNRDQLADSDICKGRMSLEAIKSNIGSPAVPEQQFVHHLGKVFIELQDLQKGNDFDAESIKQLKADMEELRKIVEDGLFDFGVKI